MYESVQLFGKIRMPMIQSSMAVRFNLKMITRIFVFFQYLFTLIGFVKQPAVTLKHNFLHFVVAYPLCKTFEQHLELCLSNPVPVLVHFKFGLVHVNVVQ